MPTLTTRATKSTGSARGDDQGDDHGRGWADILSVHADRLTPLTLPTLGDIDGGGLVMMTRATTPTACDIVPLACSPPSSSRPRRHY
jgi:hypothetical protein